MGESDSRGRPQYGRRRWWFAAVAVFVLVAGLVIVVVARGASSPGSEHSGLDRHPDHLVVNGTTLVRQLDQYVPQVVFVDAHDQRLVSVWYPQSSGKNINIQQNPGCPAELTHVFAYIADENAKSVTIGIGGYRKAAGRVSDRHVSASGHAAYIICGGSAITRHVLLPVRLNSPLGSRSVHGSDRSVPRVVQERSVPAPGYIPPGYTAGPFALSNPPAQAPMRTYRRGRYELVIAVGHPGDFAFGARAHVIIINGHRAQIVMLQEFKCVSWTASAQRSYAVCDETNDVLARSNATVLGPSLPVGELLRVARSLP